MTAVPPEAPSERLPGSGRPLRPCGPGERLQGLDGLRAVAACAVLLTHVGFQTGRTGVMTAAGEDTGGLLAALLARMDLGVAVFFTLSGFLLYRPFLRARAHGRQAPDVRAYLLRRAARVLPAYWLVLAALAVATRPDLPDLAANALLAQIYLPGALLPAFTQTWSLATEVSFYLLLPALAALLGRARSPVRALVTAVALGWLLAGLSVGVDIGGEALAARWLPAHLAWFAAGMLLAEAERAPRESWTAPLRELAARPGTCLGLAGAAYLLATTPLAGPLGLAPAAPWQAGTKELLGTVVALMLVLPSALGPERGAGGHPWHRVLGSPPARALGRVSYGIFLWHLPVLAATYAVTGWPLFSGRMVLVLLLVVPVTLVLAGVSYVLVERPVTAWAARAAPAVGTGADRRAAAKVPGWGS